MAEQAGLLKGDEVIQVGHVNLQDMTHDEVQEAIQKCGNRLEMFVIRENLLNEPKEGEPRTVKAVFHSKYNSPMDLYSKENVADTLAQHAEVITDGFNGSDFKPSCTSPISLPPVIQRSAVLQALQQEESKGINYMNGPSTPPVQKKQPPPPPPKPIPPVRSQILKSPPGGKTSPTYYSYLTQQPQIISSSCTSQDISYSGQYVHQEGIRTPTYQQQQQFYQTPRPFSPSSYKQPLLHQMTSMPDYCQQIAIPKITDQPHYPQNTMPSRVFQPSYQHTSTSVQRTYQQQTIPSVPTQPSYQQPRTPPAATSPTQLSYQQSTMHTITSSPTQPPYEKISPALATTQPTHQQLTTTPVTARTTQPSYEKLSSTLDTSQPTQTSYQKPSSNITTSRPIQPSYQKPTTPPIDARPTQSSNQQPIVTVTSRVTDQKTYQQSTTTRVQPNYKQKTTPSVTDGVMHLTNPQATTDSATTTVTHSQYEKPSKMPYSTATVIIHTKVTPPSSTPKDVQKNYQKAVEQISSPVQTSTLSWGQTQEQNRPPSQTQTTGTSPSPTASPTPSYKIRTSEGIWPPKNPTSKELPKIGFSSGWTKEISHGKNMTWPPQKPDECRGNTTPTLTSRTGAITSAWNLRPSTPPSRTPPFAGGSPLPGRRNKDLLWPPQTNEKQNVKKSSSKPLKKAHSFEECIIQHASVTVPRTYRPPPDIHQV
ncbi:adhesive plaque matrix protein-like isoform X2 [Limulus polyphemus]|nr:adhesive plaque matrix protein-like isoform X2 [Limulus polyphemus]